jgi:hypothetical protein
MKDGKLGIKDLNDAERWVALVALLTEKGFVTQEEIDETLEMMVTKKNERLEIELNANPGMKTLFDIMQNMYKGNKE